MSRWLYHATLVADDVGDPYVPASLASEGFVHASYAPTVHESIALYFPKDAALVVFQIDPGKLGFPIDVEDTPRGPMPHLPAPIPRSAIVACWTRDTLPATLPDAI